MSLRQTLLHAAAASVTISEGVVCPACRMVSFPSLGYWVHAGQPRCQRRHADGGSPVLGGMLRVYPPDLQASGSASCTVVRLARGWPPPLPAPRGSGSSAPPRLRAARVAPLRLRRRRVQRARRRHAGAAVRRLLRAHGFHVQRALLAYGAVDGAVRAHAFVFRYHVQSILVRAPGPAAARELPEAERVAAGVSPGARSVFFVKGGHELQRAAGGARLRAAPEAVAHGVAAARAGGGARGGTARLSAPEGAGHVSNSTGTRCEMMPLEPAAARSPLHRHAALRALHLASCTVWDVFIGFLSQHGALAPGALHRTAGAAEAVRLQFLPGHARRASIVWTRNMHGAARGGVRLHLAKGNGRPAPRARGGARRAPLRVAALAREGAAAPRARLRGVRAGGAVPSMAALSIVTKRQEKPRAAAARRRRRAAAPPTGAAAPGRSARRGARSYRTWRTPTAPPTRAA